MSSENAFAPGWQNDLRVGDVVAFRFPHVFDGPEEPKIRPSLVLDVFEREGRKFAVLAYGTASGAPLRRGYLIPIDAPEHLEAASLKEPTVFDGRRRLTVSLNNAQFDLCRRTQTPILGRLIGKAETRMHAVRARIHAERDIRLDRLERKRRCLSRNVVVEYRAGGKTIKQEARNV